jgi:hypothetical protein
VSAKGSGKATTICLVVETFRVNYVYANVCRPDFLLFRQYKFFGPGLKQHLVNLQNFIWSFPTYGLVSYSSKKCVYNYLHFEST